MLSKSAIVNPDNCLNILSKFLFSLSQLHSSHTMCLWYSLIRSINPDFCTYVLYQCIIFSLINYSFWSISTTTPELTLIVETQAILIKCTDIYFSFACKRLNGSWYCIITFPSTSALMKLITDANNIWYFSTLQNPLILIWLICLLYFRRPSTVPLIPTKTRV